MKKSGTILSSIALASAAVLALSGCGGSSAPAGEGGDDADALTPVTLMLNWYPYGEHAAFYYGVDQGIFEEHGIDAWEDPCETYEEFAAIRDVTDRPISTHVIDFERRRQLGVPDVFVTNLNDPGGLRAVVDIVRRCEEEGAGFRFHSGETGVVKSAARLPYGSTFEVIVPPGFLPLDPMRRRPRSASDEPSILQR